MAEADQPDGPTVFQRVAEAWGAETELGRRLESIANRSREIDGRDAAGITLVVDGRSTTWAATARLTLELDLVQYGTGEGPCLDAIRLGSVMRANFMEDSHRYPHSRRVPSTAMCKACCPCRSPHEG